MSSKSDICTESLIVDAAGISGKVSALYPGRSAILPCASSAERRCDEMAEVSRGHIRSGDRTEGPSMRNRTSGGVGDGSREAPSYPIYRKAFTICRFVFVIFVEEYRSIRFLPTANYRYK